MEDNPIIQELILATSLPKDVVERSLKKILLQAGLSPQEVTLDHIREIMSDLLNDVFTEIAGSGAKQSS